MRTSDLIDFFGSNTAATKALGLGSSGTISNWGEIVPRGMAFEIQHLTEGLLKVDLSCYKPVKRDTPEMQEMFRLRCIMRRKEKSRK